MAGGAGAVRASAAAPTAAAYLPGPLPQAHSYQLSHRCSPPAAAAAAPAPSAVACVVHLAERSVTRLPGYRSWLAGFGAGATHMLVGEAQGRGVPTARGFATLQARLNALDPDIFPLSHLGDPAGGKWLENSRGPPAPPMLLFRAAFAPVHASNPAAMAGRQCGSSCCVAEYM